MRFPGEDARWGFIEVLAVMVIIFAGVQSYRWWGPPLLAYLVYKGFVSGTFLDEFIITYLVQFVLTVGGVLFFALVVRRASIQQLGLRRTSWKHLFNWGVGGGLALFVVILGFGVLMERLFPKMPPQPFEAVLQQAGTLGEFAVLLFVISVMAPFAEELYFRGFVYPVFRNRTGIFAGIVLAGLFFGAAHFDMWRLIPLSLGGAALALIYEKSRSIYGCWVAHGLWNGAMGIIYYYTFIRV